MHRSGPEFEARQPEVRERAARAGSQDRLSGAGQPGRVMAAGYKSSWPGLPWAINHEREARRSEDAIEPRRSLGSRRAGEFEIEFTDGDGGLVEGFHDDAFFPCSALRNGG